MGQSSGKIEEKFLVSFLLLLVTGGLALVVFSVFEPLAPVAMVKRRALPKELKVAEAPRHSRSQEYRSPVAAKPVEWPKDDESRLSADKGKGKSSSPSTVTGNGALSPSELDRMLSEAMGLVDTGDPASAVKVLEKILANDPKNEMALVELGMIHLIDYKNPQKAAGFLETALTANPGNKVVLSELVGIYDELGQGQQGVKFIQDLYEQNPDNSNLALGLGEALVNQDRLKDALPYLERAAEDQSPHTLSIYADALSESGQGERAVENYSKALRIEVERSNEGYYDNQPGMAQERIALARMDLIGEYLNQRNEAKATEQLNKLREEVKDEEALATLLEQFRTNKTRGTANR